MNSPTYFFFNKILAEKRKFLESLDGYVKINVFANDR